MKNVFRVFGKMTMTMMFIVLVGLTSCEKEDVFDGKKPTEQVLGGGDEVGNPEDFYPYTDKVIVETTFDFQGEGYIEIEILEIFNMEGVVLEKRDTLKRRSIVFSGKKTTTDTMTVGYSTHYMSKNLKDIDKHNLKANMKIVFFKDGKRISKDLRSGQDIKIMNRVSNGRTLFKSDIDELYYNL